MIIGGFVGIVWGCIDFFRADRGQGVRMMGELEQIMGVGLIVSPDSQAKIRIPIGKIEPLPATKFRSTTSLTKIVTTPITNPSTPRPTAESVR